MDPVENHAPFQKMTHGLFLKLYVKVISAKGLGKSSLAQTLSEIDNFSFAIEEKLKLFGQQKDHMVPVACYTW